MLLAAEFIADRELAPLAKQRKAHQSVIDITYEGGLIIYSRRNRGSVERGHFLVCPPMITTRASRRDRADPRCRARAAGANSVSPCAEARV